MSDGVTLAVTHRTRPTWLFGHRGYWLGHSNDGDRGAANTGLETDGPKEETTPDNYANFLI